MTKSHRQWRRRGNPRCVSALLVLATLAPVASPAPADAGQSRRVIAIGDVHGAIDSLTAILQEVGLIDDRLAWTGGDAVLVQTGDVLDRGPEVRACLDLLMRLQQEAPRQGGEVIALLGNHEAMNLVSHFRDNSPADAAAFVSEDSDERRDDLWEDWRDQRRQLAETLGADEPRFDRDAWEEAHPLGYVERMEALAPDGEYGRWLRELPTAARVDDVLFMHAGLNPVYGELSVGEINAAVRDDIRRFDTTKQMMVERGFITPYADLVEMITAADDVLVTMLTRMEETGERPDAEGQALARDLQWVIEYGDWQLLDGEGLLWFRGLADWPEEEHADEVAALLEEQDIEHIVVGHTTQADGEIRSRFDGAVILEDTGMLTAVYGGRPAALEIVDGTFTAVYLGERRVIFPPGPEGAAAPSRAGGSHAATAPGGVARVVSWRSLPPAAGTGRAQARVWMGPDGAPLPFVADEEILDFLSSAEIVSIEDVGSGRSRPRRVELQRNGVHARAVFHDIQIRREQVRIGDRFHAVFRDTWQAQVAAYRLARMLGLDNVPPTVVRTIDEETGSLQLWLENEGLRTNFDRVQAGEYPLDVQAWLAQEWTMSVFDALIFNDDRHAQNVLVDADWHLWMIDHTRAFQSDAGLRDPDQLNRISRSMMARLQELRREDVAAALDDLLEPDQVNAVMARRRALLEHFGRLIDILGEDQVLYDAGADAAAPPDGLLAA